MAQVTQQSLAQSLQQTLSANAQERKQAEQFLKSVEHGEHFVVPLLQLVNSTEADEHIRFAASLYFKNFVRRGWATSDETEDTISAADRQAVKSELVGLMISAPKKLQLQLGEAVSIIAECDFPERWPELITTLVGKLSATDFHVNNGILQTAHTVFKGWRSAFRSDELYAKINYVLNEFTEAYMQVFATTDRLIGEHANNRAALQVLLHSLNLLCQIYYDLNCQDLPPFFEDHMAEFMQTFHKYLVYTNVQAEGDDDDVAGDLEEVKASICEIIELYANRYEEDFAQLPQFVETVWSMLTTVGAAHKYDTLVSRGMAFLRTVVRNPRQRQLFANGDSLQLICERIVIPNAVLPTADEELFEDDPMQFVRRDVEGSDAGSRREAAADLVRGLLDQFGAETTQAMSRFIMQSLAQYAANSADWRQKDVAMFMATSVAVVASVGALGATRVNSLVDVADFYNTHVVPHLRAVDSDRDAPILKADALKYVTTFRSQLPHDVLVQALPMLTAHLAHPDTAVATYAAVAIERLLVLKQQGVLRLGASDVQPHAEAMLSHIFTALARADSPQKLAENDYLMKTVMRVILASRTSILPLAPAALEALARILAEVSKNPSNPRFSHFLFEALGALARFACASDASAIAQFEATLFPIFQNILQQDVAEFMPYVFQILAQLLSVHQGSGRLPDAYVALLQPLLQPALWAAQPNIPALVRLLQSYLQIGGAQLAAEGSLQPILGVFQRLVASRANDHHAFALLLAVTLYVPESALANVLRPVLVLCLSRLQTSRTPKFVRNFVHYVGAILCLSSGVSMLLDTMDSIQPDLFVSLLQNILLDALPTVVGRVERKTTVVGFGLLVASPRFQNSPSYAALTTPVLLQVTSILMDAAVKDSKAQADQAQADDEDLDSLEIDDSGYQASFARLATLGDAKIDPCPQFTDAAAGLAQALKPAQSVVASSQLPAEARQFLSTLLQS
ncbi:importin-alpha export receptor [Coemansia sp. RSA 1591]|nr:importin-alpha export receptor [Coemansia sp. RSA 1591]KAJ1761798.1 importin-alpha export receptor [Coemansia sp. RSA 1752]KAJ1788422.1 importin-alpha export receptor [Coemansia sp. RSA 1938]KAJ2146019.1 importin-alpha export receptor [Coemansia sp. RSA 564]KAJ2258250.1 importin-alpha export receptor [Coemansia sp. RSA 454]KAJ2277726.1 importin-alpha export receptor [Coemansia sp. RSA 371]KAJ2426088.1 importin-alpha export receptor [Coemansia sp. RSA 2524]KAJ2554179.1 importin-alpha expor